MMQDCGCAEPQLGQNTEDLAMRVPQLRQNLVSPIIAGIEEAAVV